jgi:hypothetical protein
MSVPAFGEEVPLTDTSQMSGATKPQMTVKMNSRTDSMCALRARKRRAFFIAASGSTSFLTQLPQQFL